MRPLRIVVPMIAAGLLLASSAGAAFACSQCDPGGAMTSARAVTAKYQSLSLAKKSGYSILADTAGITCIAEPQTPPTESGSMPTMGAMGVHYVKGDLVKDPAIDAMHPEALVYAPDRHGGLHLAALEYVVIKSDWDAHNSLAGAPSWVKPAPPNLFGQEFNFTDAPNRYGLPPFYSLHAWVWKDNPAGAFAMWNPSVHCDES
jgi:hypothetical protein